MIKRQQNKTYLLTQACFNQNSAVKKTIAQGITVLNYRQVSVNALTVPYGAQWLSGRVLEWDWGAAGSSLTGVTALWSLSKTHLS